MEHSTRAPCDSNISRFDYIERDERGVAQGTQFMSKGTDGVARALGLSRDAGLNSFAPELRIIVNGVRYGVVEASVQRAKVIRADGLVCFHRQVGDGLTDVAIVVHHL